MKTGKGLEVTGNKSGDGNDALLSVPANTVESLWAHVNRLHAERGVAVLEAKRSREEQGFKSAAFQLDWAHVKNLTGAITHYEAELEKELKAEAHSVIPMLRDPEVEMPDDGFHVVAVTDDEADSVILAYHDGGQWLELDGDAVMDGSVVGWCWQDEAAEVLKKAVRHV